MQMMQMKKMMMKINGKVMENWMEKFEKYLKYVPLIYALYLPINFLLHMYEAFNGCIMPVFMYALDFVRVLVIIAFSYYLANAYTTKSQKLILNVVTTKPGMLDGKVEMQKHILI